MIKIIGLRPAPFRLQDWSLDQAGEELSQRFGFPRDVVRKIAETGKSGAAEAGEFWLSVADYRKLGAPYASVLACQVQDGAGRQVLRFNIAMGG